MASGLKFENGDFVVTSHQAVKVYGKDKVKRDLVKFLLTEKEYEENKTKIPRYNTKYGTEINRRKLYKDLPRDSIIDVMNSKLKEALSYFISLQESRTNLSLDEIIKDINFVVYNDSNDSTKIRFSLVAVMISGESLNLGNFSQRIV